MQPMQPRKTFIHVFLKKKYCVYMCYELSKQVHKISESLHLINDFSHPFLAGPIKYLN